MAQEAKFDSLKVEDITSTFSFVLREEWKDGVLVIGPSVDVATVLQEANEGIEEDLRELLNQYVKSDSAWTGMLPPYSSIPIKDGKLELGRYQRVMRLMGNNAGVLNTVFFPNSSDILRVVLDTGSKQGLVYESIPAVPGNRGAERTYDITDTVQRYFRATGLKDGTVFVMSKHTTMGLLAGNEASLVEHLGNISRVAPLSFSYTHDDWSKRLSIPPGETKNGASHVRAALTDASLRLHVMGGAITDSRIYAIDFDAPREERELVLASCRKDSYESLVIR